MKIPLVDLSAQYVSLKPEIDEAIQRVIDRSSFIGGADVREFEELFAEYCGVKHCVGLGSGTDALYVALKCLGIHRGDEVITVPNTFIATTEAISMTGARPVFTEIDEKTFNMDPLKLEKLLEQKKEQNGDRIKAVIPVHLYGQPCDMGPILRVAEKHNLKVIEDAAQAHGAWYYESIGTEDQSNRDMELSAGSDTSVCARKTGSMGDVGCFSFYPGKNLGAYGDAGAIVTNDGDLADKIRMFANHGREIKYDHAFEGINSRLDGIQAAVLKTKLKHLEEWTTKRRQNALTYNEILTEKSISNFVVHPFEAENVKHVYHLYVIRVPHREKIRDKLSQHDISTGVHYPTPLHLSPAYKHLDARQGAFPITEKVSTEILSFPMYPELTTDQISYICDRLCRVLQEVQSTKLKQLKDV
jgi:dTDP-4-amino-4,6-dideoxygalactose transaminase